MVKVGVVGATAYTSLELIKLLVKHPAVEIVYLGVRKEGNPRISEIFPSLQKILELRCTGMNPEEMPKGTDLVFVTLPPTIAMQYVPRFLQAGVKVIDFSADYRFQDKGIYEKWYKVSHTDTANLKEAVYGIPELFRDNIKNARLVSNPGCYPTSAILGLAPLVGARCNVPLHINLDDIIIDAKSGVSGRGREPREDTHYCECNENVEAYNVGAHRHAPEIEQILSMVAGSNISICFAPHLVPMNRGILSTIYAKLVGRGDSASRPYSEIMDVFNEFYRNEPFVRIKQGDELPKTKDVVGTNFCDIAVRVVGERVVVISCIDNLIKGASGQAVQNMNVMCGVEETAGLV
ncbi:MAG TPA: N-acetyl-gamma-glutamyl-phosphate reductase [Candidatus Brocadiia bacterium]|nr:N-acetyl-gamma-glutamyl-phosphate reductase [Planctomycetota bacterium]MDO8092062.1 N-acetyl-gamma-glutamyl-phosphate reductase [Candidatus Brocadiales bacterium]